MKGHWTLSIRAGLMLLVLLAVLPALALQVYDGARMRRHLIHDATAEAIRAAGSLAEVQHRITENSRMLLSTLALMPQVRHMDAAACTALFTSLRRHNPLYLNLVALDTKADILASARPCGAVNLADRRHIRQALETDAFAVGEFIVSRTAGQPTFPFAYPLHDETGALTGVLLAAIDLAAYDSIFDHLKLPAGSILGITDHQGVRLYYRSRKSTSSIGQPLRPEIWQRISRGRDTDVMLLPDPDGHNRYYAWSKARLSSNDSPYMVFMVGIPESTLLAPARQAIIVNIVLLAGAGTLALVVAWFLGCAIIARRLDRIAETADRIGQGDFSARTGLPHGPTGIANVARTIDAMAALLAANETEREQALAALRRSQERMSHITATMADWIWEIDTEDRFTYASFRVQALLGYEPTAMYGKTPYDFMPAGEQTRVRALFEAVKARGEALRDLEYWCLAQDGQAHCLLANGVPWHDETGTFQGYRGVSKDITERVRAEGAIRESLRDKEILLKEIHHRVKNNLQIISGLLYLQEEQVTDPQALVAFRESRDRIASMALVHEELYRSANLSRVCLGEYVRDLLPRLFGNDNMLPHIDSRLQLENVRVPIEQAVPCGLIINELLTNAYKHAFCGRKTGLLDIGVTERDGTITIMIRDDGPGLPPNFAPERTSSLGMQLISNLTRQLRGTITFANDEGACITLHFARQPPTAAAG